MCGVIQAADNMGLMNLKWYRKINDSIVVHIPVLAEDGAVQGIWDNCPGLFTWDKQNLRIYKLEEDCGEKNLAKLYNCPENCGILPYTTE